MIEEVLGMYLLFATICIIIVYLLALIKRPKEFEKIKDHLYNLFYVLDKLTLLIILLLLFYILIYDSIFSYLTIILILLSMEYLFFIYPYYKYLEE